MTAKPRDAALIDRMVDLARAQARLESELAATMAEFIDLRKAEPVDAVAADKGKVLAGEFAADEIAAALCWTSNRVHGEVRKFRKLAAELPRIAGLWRSGRIDGYQAGKVAEAANRLVWPESIDRLDEEAAERAPSRTASQLCRWMNRFVARLEPDQAERRHRRALADRKVCTSAEPDGMGSLWTLTNAPDLAAVDSRLTELARKLGADDPRTMDQRRADLLVDLILGRLDLSSPASSSGAPAVAITVPIQSLLGLDNTPGELADRSASVPAWLAREIAARPGTLFYRLLTDERGRLLDVTQLGRFPSDLLGFALDIRDGTCRWSTCTTAASKCDHDHTVAAPDGPTTAGNLGCGCRRHHRANTHARFGLDQPKPGAFVWTTPTGHRYAVEAEPLPVGRWPTPVIVDHLTPVAELIDLDDRDPPTDESTVRDALGPRAGPEPLLRWELDRITADE